MDFIDIRLSPPSSESPTYPCFIEALSPALLVESPDDQLAKAVSALHQSAADDLLEVLGSVSPSFFETIVLDLLQSVSR